MFLDQVIGFFSSDMGIDLGTANTLVLVKDKGIIINEPSVVAVRREKYGKQKILAVGHAAKEMVGKTPGDIEAIRPMRDGVIADFDMTERMIRYFIEKTHRRKNFLRPRIIISVPYGLTQVERKAVRESALSAGAREVFLIERPVAAAIGCGVPIFEAQGSMVIDIGGGTIDMGIVSLGGIVDSKTIRFGGSDINNALLRYVRECFGVIVSDETILDIKHTLGTAIAPLEDAEYAFQGRDMMNGLGRRCVIHQSEVYQVVNECLIGLLDEVKQMIRATAPEIVADIMQHGIWLTGGTARLSGLADRIGTELGVPVHVPEAPETKVVVGLNGASSDLVSLSRFIVNSKNRKGRD